MSDIVFLPYIRRGLAQALTTADPLSGKLPRDPEVVAWIEVSGGRVERTVQLRGPGAATALGAAQVIRQEPQPDSTGVEWNYFPLVELLAPDLPWLLTPAGPTGHDQLRPWLVLVVVREQDGVTVEPRPGTALQVLSIEPPAAPAAELPDLDDSWAWTHVQSLVAAGDVSDAVEAQSGEVIARLLCPRRLAPTTRYVACLVPAFEDGRLRGLGLPLPDTAKVAPAWTLAQPPASIELPAYVQWSFTTGDAGDFESLCRRLQPDGDGAVLGLHALDVTDPGLVDPADRPVVLDMEGALTTVDAEPRDWPDEEKAAFQDELIPLLDAGIVRAAFDPAVVDPVVAPPTYGSWLAGVDAVPDGGWVRALNVNPVRRAAAGLGAAVVRANQEALVAAAWAQAGDLRATVGMLNRGRLSAEIVRSLAGRAATLADGDLLRLTSRLQPLLPGGSQSVSTMLATSAAPAAIVSQGMLRLTRPGTALARDFAERAGRSDARVADEHVATTLRATSASGGAPSKALTFADHGLPLGAQTDDPTLEESVVATWQVETDPARFNTNVRQLAQRLGVAPKRGTSVVPKVRRRRQPLALPRAPKATDVSGIATTVRNRLDPLGAVRAGVLDRVPALDGVLADGALPTSLQLSPEFEDPLSTDLIALAAEWLVPGITALGANRVRLVEPNATFVGAFIVAANQALACELLWRGYPIDVRATLFRRFWQYVDPTRVDIDDIATGWKPASSIASNVTSDPGPMTAFVVRGDLVRRYPAAHWFLQQAAPGEDGSVVPVEGTIVEVAFLLGLDAQTMVYGFDVATDVVRGDDGGHGYFIGVEEQPAAPRFGLDVEQKGDFARKPRSWDDASWGHLVASREELDALTHARATGTRIDGLELDGATWGRNSAHQARATWQRPFRMLIHAERLI